MIKGTNTQGMKTTRETDTIHQITRQGDTNLHHRVSLATKGEGKSNIETERDTVLETKNTTTIKAEDHTEDKTKITIEENTLLLANKMFTTEDMSPGRAEKDKNNIMTRSMIRNMTKEIEKEIKDMNKIIIIVGVIQEITRDLDTRANRTTENRTEVKNTGEMKGKIQHNTRESK